MALIFLVIFFSFLRGTHYNFCSSYYRQLQVPVMIFNKKALVNISSISNSKNALWNLSSFVSRIVVNECLKNCAELFLVLLWFRVIGKTIKTFGFYNNTYLLDLSSLDVIQRHIQNCIKQLRCSVLRKYLVTWSH